MALISSGGDMPTFLSDESISELMVGHDIMMEHCYVFREDKSRLVMANSEVDLFNRVVLDWLDMCT